MGKPEKRPGTGQAEDERLLRELSERLLEISDNAVFFTDAELAQNLDDFSRTILKPAISRLAAEIDYINGAIVREGRRRGVPTPVNDTLVACIKGLEHGLAAARAPSP